MNKILHGYGNSLEKMSKAGKFDLNMYQVWIFNACKSIHYLDEIRNGLVTDKAGKRKRQENLRVIGTKHSVRSNSINILKGILEMKSAAQILADMNQQEIRETKEYNEIIRKENAQARRLNRLRVKPRKKIQKLDRIWKSYYFVD